MTKPVKLTPKQEKFCDEYLIDLNATQAAIRAGYSKKGARVRASNLLTNSNIAERIRKARDEQSMRANITAERVLREMGHIAFLDPADLFTEDGRLRPIHDMPEEARRALGGIDVHETYAGGRGDGDEPELTMIRKMKLIDKARALEMLGRHLSLFVERQEIDVRVHPTMSDESLEAINKLWKKA